MVRPGFSASLKATLIAPSVFIAALFLFPSPACLAQPSSAAAPSHPPPAALSGVSSILQPSLNTVHLTLQSLRLDKWKKGSVRDEASTNIDSIQHDLRDNLPPILQAADAGPGTVTKLLPVAKHLGALYDVLLRITEASRVSAPDDQAAQLQQALMSLSNARLALDDRIQGSAGALEKQVVDLRATVQRQAAERAAIPAPVALPCIPPPPVHKATTHRRPAAKSSTSAKPAPGKTSTKPGTTGTNQSQPSH